MAVTITGTLASPTPAGGTTPLADAVLLVYPASNAYRIQAGGSGAFLPLAYNANDPDLPDPFRYGYSTRTSGSGVYSFKIPTTAETHPSTGVKWSIRLPDGRQITGEPPSTGTYSIDDLLTNEGWELTQGLVVTAPMNGVTQDGTATASGATSVTVAFPGFNMPNNAYRVFIRADKDSNTGAVPDFDVPTKTVSGFTVTFAPGFTGNFDWFVKG